MFARRADLDWGDAALDAPLDGAAARRSMPVTLIVALAIIVVVGLLGAAVVAVEMASLARPPAPHAVNCEARAGPRTAPPTGSAGLDRPVSVERRDA
jgi:hypothetical protein